VAAKAGIAVAAMDGVVLWKRSLRAVTRDEVVVAVKGAE